MTGYPISFIVPLSGVVHKERYLRFDSRVVVLDVFGCLRNLLNKQIPESLPGDSSAGGLRWGLGADVPVLTTPSAGFPTRLCAPLHTQHHLKPSPASVPTCCPLHTAALEDCHHSKLTGQN